MKNIYKVIQEIRATSVSAIVNPKSIYENTEYIPTENMREILDVIEYQNKFDITDAETLLRANEILNNSIKYN